MSPGRLPGGLRRASDLLAGAVVLAAVLVATLSPLGGASSRLGPSSSSFSESYLLAPGASLPGPRPETFQALGLLGRVVMGQYEVRPDDTLSSLAGEFGSGADYLRSTNHLQSTNLKPGRTLVVHNGRGMLYQVRERAGRAEPLGDLARKFGLSAVEVARANRLPGAALQADAWVEPGRVIFLPGARLRFTDYLMPVAWSKGQRMISSRYGMRRHPVYRTRRFHQGLDMPRPEGTPVRAAREGTVIFAGWRGSYGRLIILKHPGGIFTWYGHLSTIDVEAGRRVAKGGFIGRVGQSGLATGPHLHFEVRDRHGNTKNPRKYLF